MHIDWFVFAAQIVNFFILVALLKFFLYDRIVKAMDARQARIASRLDAAVFHGLVVLFVHDVPFIRHPTCPPATRSICVPYSPPAV